MNGCDNGENFPFLVLFKKLYFVSVGKVKLLFFLSVFSPSAVDYYAYCCGFGFFCLPLLERGGFRKRKAGFLQTKKTLVSGEKKKSQQKKIYKAF